MVKEIEHADLVIVGAGLHGLTMTKTYLQVHPDAKVVVIDAGRSIGGTWALERLYPGLKTNNVIGSYEFGDFPMIPERYGLKAGDHIPGVVVHKYLSDFASQYNLHECIRLQMKVHSATLQSDDSWLMQLHDVSEESSSRQLLAKRMVVATGLTSEPKLPSFPESKHEFGGPVFHARELHDRSGELFEKKSVVVIGGNKSAWDTCYQVAKWGSEVHMLIRPSGGGPSYLWPKAFTWGPFRLSLATLISTRIFASLDPSPFGKSSAFSRWIRYLLHQTSLGQKLSQMFFTSLDKHIRKWHGFDSAPELANLAPWTTPFWMGNSLSIHNYETSWFSLVRDGAIKIHIAEIDSFSTGTVTLSNGGTIQADAVVCCTGWKLETSFAISPTAADAISEDRHMADEHTEKAMQHVHYKVPYLSTLAKRTSNAPNVAAELQKSTSSPLQLYRYMVPSSRSSLQRRNIAFMGKEIALNAAVAGQIQSLWITAFFDDRLSHLHSSAVDFESIQYETILHSTYQHLRRPAEAGGGGGKCADLVFDSMTYVDTMLSDLDLAVHRKSSWWKEYLEPYMPKDYQGLVAEWMANWRVKS